MIETGLNHELVNGYQLVVGLENFGPKGLEQLTNLEEVAFGGHGEDAFTLKMIDTVGFILGALSPIHGVLVGAIEVVPMWNEHGDKKAFIHGVLVHPDHQGKGVGSSLVASAVEMAFKQGCSSVAATISPANGSSLNAFLNKNHFEGTKFTKDFYGPGEHRLWVEKSSTLSVDPDITNQVKADDYDQMEDLITQNGCAVQSISMEENGTHVLQIG